MNKKLLGFVLASLFLIALATPLVATAIAGKGQDRLSFKFVVVGTYGGAPEVYEHGEATHYINLPFAATGWEAIPDTPWDVSYPALMLEIGGVEIPAEQLSYSGMITTVRMNENGGSVITVSETITITMDDVEIGTLELKVHGNTNRGEGVGNGDSFIGFGTGAFEDVKVQGETPEGNVQVGEIPIPDSDPLPISKLERVGTIMGFEPVSATVDRQMQNPGTTNVDMVNGIMTITGNYGTATDANFEPFGECNFESTINIEILFTPMTDPSNPANWISYSMNGVGAFTFDDGSTIEMSILGGTDILNVSYGYGTGVFEGVILFCNWIHEPPEPLQIWGVAVGI